MASLGHVLTWSSFLTCVVLTFSAEDRIFNFGTASGVDKVSPSTGRRYWAYYGIPFADPPVGDLRFQPPQRYSGGGPGTVITTDKPATACYQPAFDPNYVMSEDCLYLNVYVPEGSGSSTVQTPKSVMVWIYGGAFIVGDTYIYTPSRLVTERDVIVVTVNYRVGVFGFMSSGHGDGNYGLLDMIQGLTWVKDNIAMFGGNPNDVTLWGESAGAISSSILSISPKTKGLFNKVILQSGTALVPGSVSTKPGKQFDKLAEVTNCSTWFYFPWLRSRPVFRDGIINCLRRLSAEDLLSASFQLSDDSLLNPAGYGSGFGQENIASFSPTVDGQDGVLPYHPNFLMNNKKYLREAGTLDRSFIVGFNNNEALFFAELFMGSGGKKEDINTLETATKHLDGILKDRSPMWTPDTFRSVATYEYLYPRYGGKPDLQGIFNLGSDYTFIVPSIKFVRSLMKANDQMDIFVYLFDHYPTENNPGSGFKGTSHAMELAYLFDKDPWLEMYNYYTAVPDPNGRDSAIYDVIQGAWSNFAKTGSPANFLSARSSPWPRYDVTNQSYLAISTTPEVRQHVYAKRMALWTEFMS